MSSFDVCICTYAHVFVYVHFDVCMCAYMHACMHVYVYEYVYVCV